MVFYACEPVSTPYRAILHKHPVCCLILATLANRCQVGLYDETVSNLDEQSTSILDVFDILIGWQTSVYLTNPDTVVPTNVGRGISMVIDEDDEVALSH